MRRKTTYIYDRADWPAFRWDSEVLAAPLGALRLRQGRLLGTMDALGFEMRVETNLLTLTEDALKTSEIEGEILDKGQVRSSLARRLGLDRAGIKPVGKKAEAIAAVVIDATQNLEKALTRERLLAWHAALFPEGAKGRNPIIIGAWRDDSLGPMRVVSGAFGREQIHFEAPPADRIEREMHRFLDWYENGSATIDPILKAAVAHIWFVTIHPFDDGNGRIARAITDLTLARSENTSLRFYSMSARLRLERSTYYETLEATQKGYLDVTTRLSWFIGVVDRALADAEASLAATIRKSRFWDAMRHMPINERQRLMLNRLLDGFVGKLTTSKWAQIAKCSQDTALRDIDGLLQHGVLMKEPAGGRSTSYALAV